LEAFDSWAAVALTAQEDIEDEEEECGEATMAIANTQNRGVDHEEELLHFFRDSLRGLFLVLD